MNTTINWLITIGAGVILLLLLYIIIVRNWKDQKNTEETLNQDYRKKKEAEHTEDPDDLKSE